MIPLYICDVSKSQGLIDWDLLAPCLEGGYAAIKASGLWANQGDPMYAHNVAGAVSHGVPFHAYHYLYCLTEAEARRDAGLFYRIVAQEGHWPLFWVLDCEKGWGIANSRARPVAEAFEAELRRLAREGGAGKINVAIYIGHNVYKSYALDYGHYAYRWIPRYGSNTGDIADSIKPDFDCDLWQFTSNGHLPGIKGVGRVDLNVLNGSKPLGFFTGKEDTDMTTVYVGSASIDENGKAYDGKAGNQTGKELKKQAWYKHTKGWRVFRAKSAEAAEKIAAAMAAAIANKHIGYDQYQRNTLYNEAAKVGFDPGQVTADCETDCSALVRVCCAFAGIKGLPSDFRTTNEPKNLLGTGAFTEMTGDKYTKQSAYLKAGDILCTPVQGHTVVVLTNGPKADAAPEPVPQGLSRGDHGSAVETMQRLLLKWDAACLPKCGADGDFGSETELAVRDFQACHEELAVTGIYDEATRELLTFMYGDERPAPKAVLVTGGTVNVRSGPGVTGTRKLGVVRKGERLPYQGQSREISGTPWHLVEYMDQNAWISGKYSWLVSA